MESYEEVTVTLPDGYKAYGRYWSSPSPRGAVLYHHGIQSHCGWFERSPRALFEAGYAVLQVDRRGCGRNLEARGDAESADQLIGDACARRDFLFARSGFDRCHVVGVSWGGRLAVAAYVADPTGISSLSLVTPGLFPKVGVSKEVQSQIAFAMLYEPKSRFEIPLGSGELFTSKPEAQAFIDSDDLTLREATANFYLASRRMDKVIKRLPDAAPVPIHLLLAGDERIVQNDKTVEFVRGLGWPDIRITSYEGLRHALEVESDPAVFCRDLVAFIDGRQSDT